MMPVSLKLKDFEEFSRMLPPLCCLLLLPCFATFSRFCGIFQEQKIIGYDFTVRMDQNLVFLFLKVFLQNLQYFF